MSSDTIKTKLKQLKDIEDQNNYELKKIFKPVTEPLTEMLASNQNNEKCDLNVSTIRMPVKFRSDSASTPLTYEERSMSKKKLETESFDSDSEYYTDNDGALLNENGLQVSVSKYLRELYEDLNIPFGIRKVGEQLMIGSDIVKIFTTNGEPYRIKIGENEYSLTDGLKEVLLSKKPKLSLVTKEDKDIYKSILIKTNAHKRDYVDNGQLRGDKGEKYRTLIKPMFNVSNENTSKKKLGGTLSLLKRYRKNTDFIYWDDPNELVERLKLLIASKHAGNTSHDNEIISILEELKEAHIIS